MTANSPRSRPSLKAGTEPFHAEGQPIGPTLVDYWRWSASDLLSNTQRGVIAEYFVATALGTAGRPRDEWVSFDVVNENGDEIEVKSAAYRQSWAQDRPSSIQFRIAPTHWLWNPETGDNKQLDPPRRPAKIYVFCVLGRKADLNPDPLNVAQWRFYVLPTAILDREVPGQKMIRLNPLKALVRRTTGRGAIAYGSLREAIDEAL